MGSGEGAVAVERHFGLIWCCMGGHCQGHLLSVPATVTPALEWEKMTLAGTAREVVAPGLCQWGRYDFAKALENRSTSLSSLSFLMGCFFRRPEPRFIRWDHVSVVFWTNAPSALVRCCSRVRCRGCCRAYLSTLENPPPNKVGKGW